jgi:hypothetical protein
MKNLLLSYLPESLKDSNYRNGFLTIIFIALIMLIVEYYGWQGPFRRIGRMIPFVKNDLSQFNLYSQIYTSLSFLIFFFLFPFLYDKTFPIGDQYDTGLGSFELKKSFESYFPLVVLMLPLVWFATSSPEFYNFYPLYRPTNFKMFLFYELIYATQFVGIEYFFRGFGLFRLEKIMPGYGVALMVIPYSFVHIHKPFFEAIGSIGAGIVLGHLALKTRSIWPGVFTHIAIALSADTFSLHHSGLLSKLYK